MVINYNFKNLIILQIHQRKPFEQTLFFCLLDQTQVSEKSTSVGAGFMTWDKGYAFQNQLASYLVCPLPQIGKDSAENNNHNISPRQTYPSLIFRQKSDRLFRVTLNAH